MLTDIENITILIKYVVMYLSSNETIVNVLLREFDSNFQGKQFSC